ncbi:DMSO reductase anchor subunit [Sagittula marina]|uniref:DMSO reductase anchor subunit n=1 Tax=Sagittula marina TaxID=943940 RepID=A0A7W6GQS4_9RHOB|nr:DmsC/YnfH family molybdoenzyme membrane anchor subunit [Sagittula marina]MBB3983853.1 DMSO reductase anchor subunit [Sagittula marina]
MHPAPSLIAFTTLSGLGFGMLFWLGVDATPPTGWVAFVFYVIAYALSLAGLGASALHLGRPSRALKAFTQWRSSWLSREAWASLVALTVNALYAAPLVFLDQRVAPLGWSGAALALITVGSTAMIYTQLKTVPRWHHWSTPVLFVSYALSGGALMAGKVDLAVWLIPLTGLVQGGCWLAGDRRGTTSTLSTATGLHAPRAFEAPHTGDTYLTREMAFAVARKHAEKLRLIALLLGAIVPTAILLLPVNHLFALVAVVSHVAGAMTARWLFFAEAKHVMGLYYGKI